MMIYRHVAGREQRVEAVQRQGQPMTIRIQLFVFFVFVVAGRVFGQQLTFYDNRGVHYQMTVGQKAKTGSTLGSISRARARAF